jgi:hypothetical protein
VRAQLINIDGSVAWEKSAEVASSEDTTLRPFALEFPASLSAAHFVKLWLMDGEDIVSDNFYVRGTEEGNYQALRQMPHVELEQSVECERTTDGTWRGTLTLTNATATPALMVRVNVVGKEDGDQILPIFYSDNYFSLLPAEKKQITFHFKDEDTRGCQPEVVVTGYNVE